MSNIIFKTGFILGKPSIFLAASFSVLAAVFPFRVNATAQMQNAHPEHLQTTNRILCHEHETFLNLMFFFNSWSGATLRV